MPQQSTVNWDTYKAQADSPQVWTRWMLEQSLELVRMAVPVDRTLEDALARALTGPALAKPADHLGGPVSDLFQLDLGATQAGQLVALVRQAEREGVRTSGTMQRGLGGFHAAWNEYYEFLQYARENPLMSTASDRVLAMIDGWNQRDLDAILACFADDAVYHNIPMEAVHGKDGIREAISGFVAGATAIQWDMLQIAENAAGAVLTERLDKFQMGGKWVEVPVMGTFEIRNDLIVAWRDYFDLAGFQAQIQ